MLLLDVTWFCCKILVLLYYLNYVCGCPYAEMLYSGFNSIYSGYMSPASYENYQTDCHRFVVQPPAIPDTAIDHALRESKDELNRYIQLDIAASEGASVPKFISDMDRNNYFFEAATKYIQETTCSSKDTTTIYLSTLKVEKFANHINENVTKISCENGRVKAPKCSNKSLYRSIDGSCNNLDRPLDGRINDCMLRLLPPDFQDGISDARTSTDGTPLPNARILSTNLFGGEDYRPLSSIYTEFQWVVGEYVVIDSGMTLTHDLGKKPERSCDHQTGYRVNHPQYAGIPIPPTDYLRQMYENQTCMPFFRSVPCARCRLGPRMISNSVTASQDLNAVYGLSTDMLNDRRTKVGGRLKSEYVMGQEVFPVEKLNSTGRFRCFKGKCTISPFDTRNVQFVTGQLISLLFHRNHNKHARDLAKVHPQWNDERIFQEARRWNIAEYQHCIYNEYVETMIGREMTAQFDILPKAIGEFSEYKPEAPLRTIIEFQSTAGRHGHAALTEDLSIIHPKTRKECKFNYRDNDLSEQIFYGGLVDGALLGRISKPSFDTTASIPFKSILLDVPGRPFGLDLAALDIQRQRDHGIPGYIFYLQYCHNTKVRDWKDLTTFIDPKNIAKIKKYYKHIEDIDFFVGGFYERKIFDGLVGPTFACIIAKQFHNVKYGDRFFYEHGNQIGSFNTKQLSEIKRKTTFASIICKNTKLTQVLRYPLRLESETNRNVLCSKFEDFNYNYDSVKKHCCRIE